jgi:SlyX protein
MTDANESTEQRLTDLEIKASFNEDLLDQLNEVIIRQQRQIDSLIVELSDLRERLPVDAPDLGRAAADDLPPHY